MNLHTRIKYSYTSILPPETAFMYGSNTLRISHDDSTVGALLENLCNNSNIKDENGKIISNISEISYEVIE